MTAPPGIVWEDQAAQFLDQLVDRDIGYLGVEYAVERLIHAGLHDQVTVRFLVGGLPVFWHRMPPLMPGLRPIDIFTHIEENGLVHVIHMRFAKA